jgi:hypothetical protein
MYPCRKSYPKLVREVQPPHIYVRGDGRLKLSTQSSNTNLLLSPQTLVPASVLRRLRLDFAKIDNRARSGLTGRVQPIVAGTSDGVPPEELGLQVYKSASRTVLRIALPASLLRRELRSISRGGEGARGRASVISRRQFAA